MQALINAATVPSTAAFGIFTNCTTKTTPEKVVQIELIKATDTVVHLMFRNLEFLFILFIFFILVFL